MTTPHPPVHDTIPATLWTLVADAGQGGHEALGRFLSAYRQPMITHLTLRLNLSTADAEDLVHAFILDKIVATNIVGFAKRSRGRFRNFLLTALDNHVRDAGRAALAAKRAPDRADSFDDNPIHAPAADGPPPDRAFNLAWARALISRTIERMKQDSDTPEKRQMFAVFTARVLNPILDGAPPIPYDQLVKQFQFASPLQASNALVTAKRTFQRLLRQIIAEYAADEADIDREINDLFAILSRSST